MRVNMFAVRNRQKWRGYPCPSPCPKGGRVSDQNSDQVRAGRVEFLERFEFNTWGTITFREPRFSARGALRAAIYAVRKVCPRVQSGRTAAFVVAEQHESGAWHVHLLMRVDVEDLGLLCREI